MDDQTRARLGNAVLFVGLLLFVGGATAVLMDWYDSTTIAAIAALALIFVGVGASLSSRESPDS